MSSARAGQGRAGNAGEESCQAQRESGLASAGVSGGVSQEVHKVLMYIHIYIRKPRIRISLKRGYISGVAGVASRWSNMSVTHALVHEPN